eukprot:GILI01011739.1.p1 GENE.GILI01011739.1~~GILI01011739.1.p1  ORF type:complete len:102 (+),score=1.42 GILI01011739.1:261-566(+)
MPSYHYKIVSRSEISCIPLGTLIGFSLSNTLTGCSSSSMSALVLARNIHSTVLLSLTFQSSVSVNLPSLERNSCIIKLSLPLLFNCMVLLFARYRYRFSHL